MKLCVLELVGSFQQGGSERQAVQLSRSMHREGNHRVLFGTLDRSGPLASEIDWMSPSGVPEFPLTSFYNTNFVKQVKRCAAYIREEGVDVVHTHDFYTNIFGMIAASVARTPARISSKRETFSKTERQMLVERQAFRLAHKVVANAEAVKKFLVERGVPGRKVEIIHNGLDLARFGSGPGWSLSDLGLPPMNGAKLVTIVANMRSEVKNHEMFLKAAKIVSGRDAHAVFVIAGEGGRRGVLEELAAKLGIRDRVHFTGACMNVPALLMLSDICVLSSRSEGFSNVVLEYMAAAKPVVATSVGGAGEAVIDGETGYLVESNDAEAMASRLIELLKDPELSSRFGRRAQQIVEERFSLASQLERTQALYETLLSRRRTRGNENR